MEQSPTSSHNTEKRTRSTSEETRTRILDAAEELFSEKNPAHVTVRDVAHRAGVTHALVHRYIGTKDDLLKEIVNRAQPERLSLIESQPDLCTVLPVLFEDVLARRFHSRTMVRSAMDGVQYETVESRMLSARRLLDLGNSAVDSGEVRGAPREAQDVRIVLAAVTAMAYGWVAVGDWLVQLYGLSDENADMILEELKTIVSCVAELAFPPGSAECAD